MQWFKERYPEIKASSNAVDDAVREWHSASPLERFRLVLYVEVPYLVKLTAISDHFACFDRTWIRTPYLSAMAVDDVQIDVKTLKSDSMLLKLPDQAFAKIMEYAGKVRTEATLNAPILAPSAAPPHVLTQTLSFRI